MEETIRKLVDIDRACTKRVEDAKQKKIDIQKNINKKRQEIYDSFLEEQHEKLSMYKMKLEKEMAEEESKQKVIFNQKMQQLEKKYKENKEMWITNITDRCLL